MMRRLVLFPALALLASCADPCTSPATRELGTVDKLIAQTKANIARGYAYGAPGGLGVNLCVGGADNGVGLGLCTDVAGAGQPVPIDPAAERRKLATLQARATALSAQIARDEAACAR